MISDADKYLLGRAYRSAVRAVGNSDPNPAVGAVVTDATGTVVADGFTQRAGFAHAERHALAQLRGRDLAGASMYVTLEPCCHHGRTPPCTDAILGSGIRRVVIAERDFAAEVRGESVGLLRRAGVEVVEADAADFRRERWFTTGPFFFARRHQRPRVLLKWAQTAEGYIAPAEGPSGAISGAGAAALTALLRDMCKLTVSAPGTSRTDLPRLTIRLPALTADPAGFSGFFADLFRMRMEQIAQTPSAAEASEQVRPPQRLFLVSSSDPVSEARISAQQEKLQGEFAVRVLDSRSWHAGFRQSMLGLLSDIHGQGFNSVLFEAGPRFSRQMFEDDLVDAFVVYQSRVQTGTALWGMPGRDNGISRMVSQQPGAEELAGFSLLEYGELGQDTVSWYVRRA